ncbi:MAG: hypothetical protein HKN81_02000 [Gammaproteobacteria bacterium]|nr:hypothetical protein [Gammaproteobacteria bacterium]
MAKRASETFFVATKTGAVQYIKDRIVPAAVAKQAPSKVYDDGAPEPKKSTAKK